MGLGAGEKKIQWLKRNEDQPGTSGPVRLSLMMIKNTGAKEFPIVRQAKVSMAKKYDQSLRLNELDEQMIILWVKKGYSILVPHFGAMPNCRWFKSWGKNPVGQASVSDFSNKQIRSQLGKPPKQPVTGHGDGASLWPSPVLRSNPKRPPRPLALTESIVLPEKVKSKGRPEEPGR